jgi:hypothetical protein
MTCPCGHTDLWVSPWSKPEIEFRALFLPFVAIFRDFLELILSEKLDILPETVGNGGQLMGVGLGFLMLHETCQGQIDPGAEGTH